MTTCDCGCSTFGPGPHDRAARHPRARSCDHDELGIGINAGGMSVLVALWVYAMASVLGLLSVVGFAIWIRR